MNRVIKKITAIIAAISLITTVFAGVFTVSAVNTDVYTAFEKHTFEGEIKLGYRLHIPENYDETKKYPVVVFLHGLDARGSDNNKQLSVFIDDLFASETSELHDAIVIAPQCPPNKRWVDAVGVDGCYSSDELPETDQLKTVIQLIEHIKETYSADNDRVYAMGLSMGGYGTWDLITRHPSVFAAALPICGAGDPAKAEILSKIPIWTLHGNKDKVVDFATSTPVMVKAIRQFADNRLKYDELDGWGHEAWEYVEKHPEYITWLFSQKYDRDDNDRPCATHTYGEEDTVKKTCYSGYTYRVCSKCGYVKKYNYDYSSHTYKSVTTEATCTTGGYTTNTCTVCGYVLINNKVDPLDHNYTAVTTPKTCTTDGNIKYTCSRCSSSYSVPIPASHNVGKWEIITEPTYSEAGQRKGTCKDCYGNVLQYILPLKEGTAYDWNYADKSVGETVAASTLENSAVIPGTSADKVTYNAAGYLQIPANPEYTSVLFNTPTGFEPYKFTMTAPNNAGGSNGDSAGAGAAVIGNITYGSGDSAVSKPCFVWVVSVTESNGCRGAYLIMQDQSGKILLRKPLNLSKNGVYTGSNQYKDAMNVADIGASNVANLTHTYTVTANGSSVTVAVKSTYYSKLQNATYSADAEPITITADDFAKIDDSITSFTPMFGLARSYWGIGTYNFNSRYYSVKSEYIKCTSENCKHQNTKIIDKIPATCVAAGKTEEVVCADCGAHISGGETIKALGHDYKTVTVESTCEKAGTTTTTCSRCDYKDVKALPLKEHTRSEWITDTPATATENGSKHIECTVCHKVLETATIPKTGRPVGDANGDGKIDTNDAIAVMRYDALLETLSDEAIAAADVNGDGKVDIIDAILILQYDSEIISEFPVNKK